MSATPPPSALHNLGDIRKLLGQLSAALQRLRDYAIQLNLTAEAQLIDETIAHLQSDTFTVAVVGAFKRGKSTFINALLGRDVLPTDILPTTATLNRVVYGLQPEARIQFNNGHSEAVELASLSSFVTKLTAGSRDKAATIAEAVVQLPVPYLRNNVEIIDTPGLNDELAMDLVTKSVIPRVDAAILVVTPQEPLSDDEIAFVENTLLASALGRVLFVLTRIDTLDGPDDVARMISFIEDRVREKLQEHLAQTYGADSAAYNAALRKIGPPRVFGVAGKLALAGKLNNDAAKLSASRFPEFEAAMERFLSEERGPIMLQVPINRVLAAAPRLLNTAKARQAQLAQDRAGLAQPYEINRQAQEDVRGRAEALLPQLEALPPLIATRLDQAVAPLPALLASTADHIIDNAQFSAEDLDRDINAVDTNLNQALTQAVAEASRTWWVQVREIGRQQLHDQAEQIRQIAQLADTSLGNPFGPLADPLFALAPQFSQRINALAKTFGDHLAGPQPAQPGQGGFKLGVSSLMGRAADAAGIMNNLPGMRGGVGKMLGNSVVKSYRELKKRQAHDAINKSLSSTFGDDAAAANPPVASAPQAAAPDAGKNSPLNRYIASAFFSVPITLLVRQLLMPEVVAAKAQLSNGISTNILPAVNRNLVKLAEQRARREAEIEIELRQLNTLLTITAQIQSDAQTWLAQIAPVAKR